MRRILIIILSAFLLAGAASYASESYASKSKRAKTTKTTKSSRKKTKATKKKAPVIVVNTDSIEAAHRAQLRADSLRHLQALADSGDISAIVDLGAWYYTGHIVDQSYDRAVALWRKAADASSARALADLGMCYELGHGVAPDPAEAARLYVQSIKCGNGSLFKQKLDSASTNVVDALLIGECYERGEGIRQDMARAAELYANASSLGSDEGTRRAGLCYLAAGDTASARDYLALGAALGDKACRYWTGALILRDGTPTPDDSRKAVDYILDAAEAGMPEAQCSAGILYRDGRFVAADHARALGLLRQAAAQGYAPAMLNYALALGRGQGLAAPDYAGALNYLAKAAQAGVEVDLEALGSAASPWGAYLRGMRALLVSADPAAAMQWMKQVSKLDKKAPSPKVMQQVILADETYAKAKPAKAVRKLEDMAAGAPEAAFWLADIYSRGATGVPRDEARAAFLTHKLQESGDAFDIPAVVDLLAKSALQ